MKKIFLSMLIAGISTFCFAQTDSTIIYKNDFDKNTTADSATTYTVLKTTGNVWYGKTYDIKTKTLKQEGNYAKADATKRFGDFKVYSKTGFVEQVTVYEDGKAKEVTWYYKDGAKRSHMIFDEKGKPAEQIGWDEKGNEIKNFIVFQSARFQGGDEAWRKYLERKLDRSIPAKEGLPEGKYTVIVSFIVLEDGSLSNVRATKYPANCKACANEAVRVIFDGPKWEPAIQNNQLTKFSLQQGITFFIAY